MMRRGSIAFPILLFLLAFSSASAGQGVQTGLTVVSAGPQGETKTLGQANEIRVVFSEPMVSLGRIPDPVQAPFFQITPSVPGTFRWSGTTILIFTPDPKKPLPYSTRFEVTIDTTAAALSGRRLAAPYRFSFTTPTVQLLRATRMRRGGRYDAPFQVMLRFNQAVRPADVLAHLNARFEAHEWDDDFLPELERSIRASAPESLPAFTKKVAETRAAASATAPVQFAIATEWDQKAYPPSPDLVVLEARTPVPPGSWIRLVLDGGLPSPAGSAVPGRTQSVHLEGEPVFWATLFSCHRSCDPDRRNELIFTGDVHVDDFAAATSVVDVTGGRRQPVAKTGKPRPRDEYAWSEDVSIGFSLEDAGYDAQPPASVYEVRVDGSLRSRDGQTLGFVWVRTIDNGHRSAFTSFGDGHGVWEKDGGATLPFYARNMASVRQRVVPLRPSDLMPAILSKPSELTSGEGAERRLPVTPDRVQSHGIDISSALSPSGTGLLQATIREGDAIPGAPRYTSSEADRTRRSIVQVTNLGISVKDSPLNTLIFVTRLDNGEPVGGATVSIVRRDNTVHWSGTTDANGVAIAPNTRLREPNNWWQLSFIVTAEKDGDVAYVASDWNEGIQPWDFGSSYDLDQAEPLLRGSVFTDRGVYRLGEEVHFKAILRQNAPDGVHLLPAGTPVLISVRDTQDRLVDERVVKVTQWSSAEWTMTLPAEGNLGNYSIRVIHESDRPQKKAPEELEPWQRGRPGLDDYVPYHKSVTGSFLVAAYRRPDFRVDVTLKSETAMAGDPIEAHVSARYLFGAPMGERPVTWRYSYSRSWGVPAAVTGKFPADRWVFVGSDERDERRFGDRKREETKLQPGGQLSLSLDTDRGAGVPFVYTLEADVEDVSRQHIANRASVTIHPAPWYIGLRRPAYFIDRKAGLKTEIVAVRTNGAIAAGVPVELTLTQVQWHSVRRSEGGGFYTWETERRLIPAGSWQITTAQEPIPFEVPLDNGGYFILEAKGVGEDGRFAKTTTAFYALGDGYTAWMRYDHNRIDLVPEKTTYKPGETARIMIQSPWERATAIMTTEREGVRSHRQFTLTSTQQYIDVPITEADIPNVFVSVLLVKGRTAAAARPEDVAAAESGPSNSATVVDASDPGKPAFRLGYVELEVEDQTKRLSVAVTANRQEYRPATEAKVDLVVRDHAGRGVESEVTLWAVDYGVLSLTSFQTPDVLRSVYVRKALQVMNTDTRQRIISRRVLTPKGETDGGGGGMDAGAGTMRKDSRVLAFWLGSVTTNGRGRASVDVKLPESLTTYRIMAVAADRQSRFGSADAEIRINKPLTMTPAFPRFLAVGDKAFFGAVVTSQLPSAGSAVITVKSLDPHILAIGPDAQQTVSLGPGGSAEVRFEGAGRAIGRARVQMTVRMGRETDAFEDVIPVEVLASAETVAAHGELAGAETRAAEAITIPSGVVPGFGGLTVELSSTAMVGLGEGARYLVEYPYGCAEQKASRARAMLLAADLGDAFTLPGMDTAKMRPAVQRALRELETFQCGDGGFAYWPGACWSRSPYLTAYVLDVFRQAADFGYAVDPAVRERGYSYLERELGTAPPKEEGWWPSYTAWQTFAVKVLAEGGRNQDSNITRLYGYLDRMPVFAHAYLHDALMAKGETAGARVTELRRRMLNAILPEGGSAHVEELSDEYLLWFWNSNVRSTGIVLASLVKAKVENAPVREMVRWLMSVRKDGRWGNTQENAHAMQALVDYYRAYESVTPDFRAAVALGDKPVMDRPFKGRSTEAVSSSLPLATVLEAGTAGEQVPLTFSREGEGTLFYSARLRYAPDARSLEGLDAGFSLERRYEPLVNGTAGAETTTFAAGDLVRVTLTLRLTKERRFVAVTDPLPAGFEAVESWFATTAGDLAKLQDESLNDSGGWDWWRRGGFDYVERHDDRVQLFATRLSEGVHEFSYVARATTAGTFHTAPARAEEMYSPEVFGRTATAVIEVQR